MFTHQVRVENQSRFEWGKRFVDVMYVYTIRVSLFFIDIYAYISILLGRSTIRGYISFGRVWLCLVFGGYPK